jgi:hypothetical protein
LLPSPTMPMAGSDSRNALTPAQQRQVLAFLDSL